MASFSKRCRAEKYRLALHSSLSSLFRFDECCSENIEQHRPTYNSLGSVFFLPILFFSGFDLSHVILNQLIAFRMVHKKIFLSMFCLMKCAFEDNYLCLLYNVYVMNLHLPLAHPKNSYAYYLGLHGTFRTLYWAPRVFDYYCCSEVSLGPLSLVNR